MPMSKSYRAINFFISHPFEPNNGTYDIEKFRTNITLLISEAENIVRKEYQDFQIDTTFIFSDSLVSLPAQIEAKIRSCHIAIVDISESKPNIFFEYGLLYGLNVPVILIKAEITLEDFPIPADLKDRIPHLYKNFEELRSVVVENLSNILKTLINSDALYNIYLQKIWFPSDIDTVHIVTSTESEKREQFALPESDNYMLLESLGDKDSLLAVATFLSRNYRNLKIPMYPADAMISLEENLVIIGGPGDEDGDGNEKCSVFMDKINSKVSYSEDCEKLIYKGNEYLATKKGKKTARDYGYFARFPNPFNPRTSVVLLHGIHTFGVLGAAKAFSDHPSAQANIRKVLQKLNLDDIRQAAFECFFEVVVYGQGVVCPEIDTDHILPLTHPS